MVTALRVRQSCAVQKYLAEQISFEQILVEEFPERASPQPQISVQKEESGMGKAVGHTYSYVI